MKRLTVRELAKVLAYDGKSGVLTWKPRAVSYFASQKSCNTWNTRFAGTAAGAIDSRGYVVVTLFGKRRYAHVLAWALGTGYFPLHVVDHVNGKRNDNRFANLRDVPHLTNCRNSAMKRNNTSGVNGVYWDRNKNKWHARVKVNAAYRHLGYFDNLNDATIARAAADKVVGFTPRHGGKHASP